MTDKQIIDEIEINPNDWLLPYKDIPACEIKDCNEIVYCGDGILGCRIAETGLVCDDFNNPEEACMYRQLEYYKETLKAKEQECEELKEARKNSRCAWKSLEGTFCPEAQEQLEAYKMEADEGKEINAELKAENDKYSFFIEKLCDYAGLECDDEEQAMRTLYDLASQMNKARWIIDRYKQTLTEIKPILEFYANSTLGEEQEDGTYRIELSYKYGSGNMYGAPPCYYQYNPKPARQALQKISECEVE